MTKYSIAFVFLLILTISNAFLFGFKDGQSQKIHFKNAQQIGVDLVAVPPVKRAWKDVAEPDRQDVVLRTWKETEDFEYVPYQPQRALGSERLSEQGDSDSTIISKGIRYVKIPFKGKHIYVSSDYYMVDGIRKPLSLKLAQRVAREHGAVLPTKEMVDAIWRYADLKLQPQPLQPGPLMTRPVYFTKHDSLIDKQISKRRFRLVAGHKKDIIRPQRSGRVTIYGWHRLNGKPIQPYSNVHDANYADYSHGLRLVKLAS